MRRIILMTVSNAESTTESLSAISHTFHNYIQKQNPYHYERRRRRRRRFILRVQYIISIRDTEGNKLGSVHASTTYGM
jgi:hypothetical protein